MFCFVKVAYCIWKYYIFFNSNYHVNLVENKSPIKSNVVLDKFKYPRILLPYSEHSRLISFHSLYFHISKGISTETYIIVLLKLIKTTSHHKVSRFQKSQLIINFCLPWCSGSVTSIHSCCYVRNSSRCCRMRQIAH